MAEAIQSQLTQVGIDVAIKVLERGAFLDAEAQGEFEMLLRTGYYVWGDYPRHFFIHFSSNEYSHYSDAGYDRLIRQADATVAPEAQRELYWRLQEETLWFPAVAVGLQGVGKDTTAEPYLALSRDAGSVRLHTGAIHLEHHTSWIFGVESSLGPGLAVCGDYVSGDAGTASVGLSWEISDAVSVAAARIFANDSEEEDNWYFNIGYAIAWSQ